MEGEQHVWKQLTTFKEKQDGAWHAHTHARVHYERCCFGKEASACFCCCSMVAKRSTWQWIQATSLLSGSHSCAACEKRSAAEGPLSFRCASATEHSSKAMCSTPSCSSGFSFWRRA